ncbi:hypothetical protein FRC03_006407 [Tulasnella sp. 419]|nr:hypothetical protein FRC03_006407 [Tulasnella sp. 419]
MSSFKRKLAPSTQPPPVGTRVTPRSSLLYELSTGISSLDDVLGSGQSLGSVLTILTPDPHSAWGNLLQRYYIAQGLVLDQPLCLVGETKSCRTVLEGCMWVAGVEGASGAEPVNDEEEEQSDTKESVKIAWRYEKMGRFQTTVDTKPNAKFCNTFDLTTVLPGSKIAEATANGHLNFIDVSARVNGRRRSPRDILHEIKTLINRLHETGSSTSNHAVKPLRICIPDLGGPAWGDLSGPALLQFLFALRQIVQSSLVAVLITFPPHLSSNNPRFTSGKSEHEWIQKLAYVSDGCISFNSFGADPSLASMFPSYHGLVQVYSTPSLHTLVPTSHTHSLLRGLSSPSNHAAGGGENNLGFRCTRKRFVIETLHLDVEGGVSERRTAPPISIHDDHKHGSTDQNIMEKHTDSVRSGLATVQLESPVPETTSESPAPPKSSSSFKPKKKVGFQSDRPSLYDF